MSRTTRARARALRHRLELGRLRALGGLSQRVVVDGASVLRWCGGVGANYAAVIAEIAAAAAAGHRELVVVTPACAPVTLKSPHQVIASSESVAGLLWALSDVQLPSLPSVVVADVQAEPKVLNVLDWGPLNVLDVATGRLEHGEVRDRYDVDLAEERGVEVALRGPPESRALACAITAPLVSRTGGRLHVATECHREDGAVVLDGVAVDDGVRRHARGHRESLALLTDALSSRVVPVMTSSMDIMDALYDAGVTLPPAVEDPALACVVLDPDEPKAPPGIGRVWRSLLLGCRGERAIRVQLDAVLDELPGIHEELRASLAKETLLSVYDDVCKTAPLFAAIEREGFRVDANRLATDVATVLLEMDRAWQVIVSGPHAAAFQNLDLVRAPTDEVAELIQLSDGPLASSWHTGPPELDRFALAGNVRALAVQRLRALAAIHEWMKKLEGTPRLRSILAPASTGRWYPHGEALFTIPKHEREAMLLRKHLVPEPGHVFVSGDYAAFEPRLLAHQSTDPTLIKACNAPDVYDYLRPHLGVTTRDVAKHAVLAFMYGRSPSSFAESLPSPVSDGYKIYKALEATLPGALEYRDHVHATETRVAKTMRGWRRARGTESASEFARKAFNLKMQGSAGDLLRKLLRDLSAALPTGARVVHQEFDAAIVTCPADVAATVEQVLKHAMENVAPLGVPLRAKTKHGATLAAVS